MTDIPPDVPPLVARAEQIALRGQFRMSSEPRVGALLRALAASKPRGRFLELGSGVGVGSAWLLSGMDSESQLTTLEIHERTAEVCRRILADDPRAEVITADAETWLEAYEGPPFDLLFVDTTHVKFNRRDLLVRVMRVGSILLADDLVPQETWTERHPELVERFRAEIVEDPRFAATVIDWASGVCIATLRAG